MTAGLLFSFCSFKNYQDIISYSRHFVFYRFGAFKIDNDKENSRNQHIKYIQKRLFTRSSWKTFPILLQIHLWEFKPVYKAFIRRDVYKAWFQHWKKRWQKCMAVGLGGDSFKGDKNEYYPINWCLLFNDSLGAFNHIIITEIFGIVTVVCNSLFSIYCDYVPSCQWKILHFVIPDQTDQCANFEDGTEATSTSPLIMQSELFRAQSEHCT